MEIKARIPSAPLPSLITDAVPKDDSPKAGRMTPTEASACDQAIVQQRQQSTSNPSSPICPPRSSINQRRLPLTPLGYELTTPPGRGRHHPSRPSSMGPLQQPVSPDPVPNPAVEPPLASENISPPLSHEHPSPKSPL